MSKFECWVPKVHPTLRSLGWDRKHWLCIICRKTTTKPLEHTCHE